MSEYEITNMSHYRGYKINTGRSHQFYCYIKILDEIIDRVEYMLENHSKVLFCRIDIRIPNGMRCDIDHLTTRFMEGIQRKLEAESRKRNNKVEKRYRKNMFEMHYVWCAERNTADNDHVHCLILLNGHDKESGWEDGLVQKDKFWWDYEGKRKERYELMIDRSSIYYENQIDLAIYVASYLAKTTYRNNIKKGERLSHCSRLPHK